MTQVSIILPTRNEASSVSILLPRLHSLGYPVIIVDDESYDGTPELVLSMNLPLVTLISRSNRGLGSAIRTGAGVARTSHVVVMDSDGQHRIEDLEKMLSVLGSNPFPDIIIGSRFLQGGGVEGLPPWRHQASRVLNNLARVRAKTPSTDYLTGMFLCPRELVLETREDGFKILFDILKHNSLVAHEVPITLTHRNGGQSKAGVNELWRFMKAVLS